MIDFQVKAWAAFFALCGVAVCGYKVLHLGLPLLPDTHEEVYTVELRTSYSGRGEPVSAKLAIPSSTPGFIILDEDFVGRGYGFNLEETDAGRTAIWAAREANGQQTLYYRVAVAKADDNEDELTEVSAPTEPAYLAPVAAAVLDELAEVRAYSADPASFTGELIKRFNAVEPSSSMSLIRKQATDRQRSSELLVEMLISAGLRARLVLGITVGTARSDESLEPMLQVYSVEPDLTANREKPNNANGEWLWFNPVTGQPGRPDNFLVWNVGSAPVLTLNGSGLPLQRFATGTVQRELVEVAKGRASWAGSSLMEFSLFGLPQETQNVYRILLLVPIGALLVVLLRNVVGVKTFGTFMPVLIGITFLQTGAVWGVILFTALVGTGLLLRLYLDKLRLLLVPRLSAVLTIVVLLMIVISVLSHQMGSAKPLSIALFPMVILAMTIERMSLVWEEHGASEAMVQAGGTVVTALVAYLLMNLEFVKHLAFVFPELMLVLLAFILLMGRYTGYRLTELWRFRHSLQEEAS